MLDTTGTIETATGVRKQRLPNLTYPDIRPVRADRFVIDITEGRQRDPEKRIKKLIAQFGENGERFNFDDFEVVTAIARPDGSYFPSGGMGRVWAVLNLLKRPDLELPTLVKRSQGDQVEKRSFLVTQTNTVPLTAGQRFMTEGHITGKEFSPHRAIVEVLTQLGCTTAPGHGAKTITLSAAIFAGRLGVLREAYTLARRWWYPEQKGGEYVRMVEGTAIDVCAALLYVYGPLNKKQWARFDKLNENTSFEELRSAAQDQYGEANDQNRDQAPHILRLMLDRFNRNQQTGRLQWSEAQAIRDDFANDEFWKGMNDAWRMLARGETRADYTE